MKTSKNNSSSMKGSQSQTDAVVLKSKPNKEIVSNIPSLRFPEFRDADDWVSKELGDCLDYSQPTKYLVDSTEYSDKYQTPVLTAGKTFILGYTNEKIGVFSEKLPVIIFDDFTTATKFVDFPFKAKSSAMKILLAKKNINIKFVYEIVQTIKFEVGVHKRQWISVFSKFEVLIPKPNEQQKIADCLSSLDELIETHAKKVETLKEHKKGLMQQLFPTDGETVPKLRFPEFISSGGWVSKKLKEITGYVDYRGRAPIKTDDGYFLVTAKNIKKGYIDYKTSKEYVGLDDYLNVMSKGLPEIGDVLFTTEAPMGNIAQVDNKNIALAQRVIKFRGNNLLKNDFLKHYMISSQFQELLYSNAFGSTVLGIQGKILHNLNLIIPKPPEQQKIADFLSTLDELIEAETKKVESLKVHKKGLMQQLFVSGVGV